MARFHTRLRKLERAVMAGGRACECYRRPVMTVEVSHLGTLVQGEYPPELCSDCAELPEPKPIRVIVVQRPAARFPDSASEGSLRDAAESPASQST